MSSLSRHTLNARALLGQPCIDRRLYGGDGAPLSQREAAALLQSEARVIAKPSLGSHAGLGVEIWNPAHLGSDKLIEKLSTYGANFVVQRLIIQHDTLAQLNASSVNIIRINTLRIGARIEVLHATIRFSIPGSVTDVAYPDGREALRLVGVKTDGRMFDDVLDEQGKSFPLEQYRLERGTLVPGFKEACEVCINLHSRLQHFDLVGFDVAIEKDGNPTVVEFNLCGPGVMFYQLVHGPFFGEHTTQLIETLSHVKPMKPSFILA